MRQKIAHPKTVNKIISLDDHCGISGCEDGVLRLWDQRTANFSRTLDLGAAISDLELSRDGKILTIASGKRVVFLDVSSGDGFTPMREHTLPRVIEAASLCEDRKTFITCGTNLWAYIYDFETGKEQATRKGHHGPVHCVRYAPSPWSHNFCSGADDATLRLWVYEKGS